MVALFTSMLKKTVPLERSISDKLGVDDNEGGISIGGDSIEHAKKSRKSKAQKLSMF